VASIFVQIAAYRDLEVTPTILDAIKQSSGNHTINFGVHTVYFDESEINLLNSLLISGSIVAVLPH
jgi:hypothetical protein